MEAKDQKKVLKAADDPCALVKVKLGRNRNEGRGVYVNVNNSNYYIPRGQVVEVPRYIAEVIERSVLQDEHTAAMIDSLTTR